MKLTPAQRKTLECIRKINDEGRSAHIVNLPCNRGVMERLENAGLIGSERPFAYSYHSVTLTPAGRQALATSGGPDET